MKIFRKVKFFILFLILSTILKITRKRGKLQEQQLIIHGLEMIINGRTSALKDSVIEKYFSGWKIQPGTTTIGKIKNYAAVKNHKSDLYNAVSTRAKIFSKFYERKRMIFCHFFLAVARRRGVREIINARKAQRDVETRATWIRSIFVQW